MAPVVEAASMSLIMNESKVLTHCALASFLHRYRSDVAVVANEKINDIKTAGMNVN
jgi:hypothetical protein